MVEISLLGPTDVRVAGQAVALSPLERNLITILALSRGRVVSTERIVDYLWGDRPPAAPRSRVQGLISTLRRKVGGVLVTRHPGYLLAAEAAAVDLDRCEELARQARRAETPAEVATHLQQALALWRGEPLDGVSAPGVEYDRVRLTEQRLVLQEQLYAAELELGRHAELVSELASAVSVHPLREQLAGQLMVALYRSNRQADALKVYQALRERLADELGTDPSADLRELHAAILRGEPVTRFSPQAGVELAEAPEVRPAQLPASVGYFTDRQRELDALTHAADRPGDEPRVLLVTGAGGIGKTAFVVRWAHSVAGRYPDGQIFVDLYGRTPGESLAIDGALALVLGALGVGRRGLPETMDERTALYRTLVSGRRVLIVADDAGALEQVLALVPPTTGSHLVVTSRRRMIALAAHHAVHSIQMDPLSLRATRELLERIVGRERMRDPDADRVVRWCGGWPLATRLVGTKLAARPWQSIASFATELEDLPDLVLEDDPRSVQAALLSAHDALSPAAAHLFGRIGLNPAALCLRYPTNGDASMRRLRRLLDELVAANLLLEVGQGRYRLHDVVRRFARQCGAELADRDTVDEWVRQPGAAPPDAGVADSKRI